MSAVPKAGFAASWSAKREGDPIKIQERAMILQLAINKLRGKRIAQQKETSDIASD
jgi:hypothetical protein